MNMRASMLNIAILLGLLALFAAGVFTHRDMLGVEIMEARNVATAQEMIQTGHWFLPTLFGELRLAKPPLPTWLTAAAMLAGNGGLDTDLAVNRIPSALAALLLVVSLFGLTRFWTRSTAAAAWSTAFLSTSYMFVLMARRNNWDIYCHAFMLAAIWCLAVILESPGPRRKLALGAGLLLGLSGLSKGPVSFYALLLPFLAAMLASGGLAGMRRHFRDLALALAVGLALSLSWSVAAWVSMPQAFSGMLATEQGAWFERHTKPFWFYLQFPAMTGIWTLVACAALWPGHARARVEALLPYWRPFAWTVGSVVLLMLVPEKKDRYLLPVLVPLCQLMGVYLAGLLRDPEQGGRPGRLLVLAQSLVFMACCLAVPAALWWLRGRFPALGFLSLSAATVLGGLLALLIHWLRKSGNLLRLFLVEFGTLGLLAFALPGLVQPPAGDMSVPLEQVRAFAGGLPLVEDGSLKTQDYWVVGGKPRELGGKVGEKLPDRVCFVSRRNGASVPEGLEGFSAQDEVIVSDFSGAALRLAILARESIEADRQ